MLSLFLSTYPLRTIVARMDAKVEGLPMPFSSRAFTREASVKRAGGFVLCESDSSVLQISFSSA